MKKQWVVNLSVALLICAGCVSFEEEKIRPDTPVMLYSPAKALKGAEPKELYVNSKFTVAEVPMHSRMIQRVAGLSEPAVVSIYVKTETPVKIRLIPIKFSFTGIPASLPGIGLGSGFFIHPDGWVLTNEHVVHNASDIRVMIQNGVDFKARLVAVDPAYDLALLKVESPNGLPFSFLPMGRSDSLAGGDHVIAIGNPLGFGHTVTAGIVSHTGRSLFEEEEPGQRYARYLQTDAAINPGSSGGPLITLTGAWAGVNTAKIENSQGIGFAVPSSQAQEFLTNVLEGKGVAIQR